MVAQMGTQRTQTLLAIGVALWGALSLANQAISNLRFIEHIPGAGAALNTVFGTARILAGPALFIGIWWLIIISVGGLWRWLRPYFGREPTRARAFTVLASDVIQYIMTRSTLSISFTQNPPALAAKAFWAAIQTGRLIVAGRRPESPEVMPISLAEIGRLVPACPFLPLPEDVMIPPSSFALVDRETLQIVYESVLCDPGEVTRIWPSRF